MLEQKTVVLDGLQSKVADIIAEELQVQESVDNNLLSMIGDRADGIKKEIGTEQNLSSEAINTLRLYLEEDVPNLYDRLRDGIREREETEEMM
jgi:hypothetical protein